MKKTIKIACRGAGVLGLPLMVPLQGDLKTISEEDLAKIKNEIITDGFSFPIAIWEDEKQNKLFILDGHQRYKALTSLKKDGYSIPEIPIVMVDAESYEQAKHKLLAAASQYGKVDQVGVMDFLKDIDITRDDFMSNFKLDINLDLIPFGEEELIEDEETGVIKVSGHDRKTSSGSSTEDHWKDMPEFKQEDKTSHRHVVVHFRSDEDVEEFFALIGQTCTDKTRSIWYPKQENMDTESKRY